MASTLKGKNREPLVIGSGFVSYIFTIILYNHITEHLKKYNKKSPIALTIIIMVIYSLHGCGRSAQPDLVPADASCRANQCTGGSLQVLFTCCVAPRFEVGSVRGTWGPLLKVSPDIETSGLSFPSTIDSN